MTSLPGRQPAGSASAQHPSRESAPSASPARHASRGRSGPPPVRVSGRFFELTGVLPRSTGTPDAVPASPATSVTRTCSSAGSASAASILASDLLDALQISVPKRLVRAAVRRNTVKRVAREAWRAAPAILHACGRSWRLRLKAHPMGSLAAKSQHARAQMRVQARRKPDSAMARQPAPPGFGTIKRQLRAELDQLLADAAQRLNRRPSAHGRPSDVAVARPSDMSPARSSGHVRQQSSGPA